MSSRPGRAATALSLDGVLRRSLEALPSAQLVEISSANSARPTRLSAHHGPTTSLHPRADGPRRGRAARSSKNTRGALTRPLHGRPCRADPGAEFSRAREKFDHGCQRFRFGHAAWSGLYSRLAALACAWLG